MIRFAVDQQKTVEALVYVATLLPGVTRFHASKILYFADLSHLTAFGRPVTGDHYIAMENGPVPSFAYNVLKGRAYGDQRPFIEGALVENTAGRHPSYSAARPANMDYFSRSDIDALEGAVAHCRGRTFGDISDETHKHPAWAEAPDNAPMKFESMLSGADEAIVDEARAFSAYGVL